jgi:hypothetical protein
MRRLAVWIGMGILLFGGIVALLVWQANERPAESAESAKDLSVPVGYESSSMVTASMLDPELSEEVAYSIGPIQGRVTALGPVGRIQNGAILLSVDGLARPVLLSPSPLWRALAWGTEGPDVTAVANLLEDLGFLDPEQRPVRVDAPFVRAVRAFENAIGWPLTGVFRPEYAVWFPPQSHEFSAFEVSLGELVHPESVVAVKSPEVRSARVLRRDGSRLDLPDVGPSWEFAVTEGPVVGLDLSGTVTEGLDLLVDYIDQETGTVPGLTRLSTPVQWQTVPGASIGTDDDGALCLMSSDGRTWPVTVVGSSLGVTRIIPTLPEGAEVLVPAGPLVGTCGDSA